MVTCRVDTVCIIDSLFCGKIIFARPLEGEAVVIDDALVINSYFFSRSVITVTSSSGSVAQGSRGRSTRGLKVLIGNFLGYIFLFYVSSP